ncbi:MAG TPA: HNH endonuclease, partial [Prolixibacteraceae bacterium]|nr:HNH endonuclease [Prolixibacteraceae bacterium]
QVRLTSKFVLKFLNKFQYVHSQKFYSAKLIVHYAKTCRTGKKTTKQFRKAVLKTYNSQCAVSGLKVESSEEDLLVDACHIVPFTQTSDDSIRNGIALSPTIHRAFDNGLIAIDDNYRILVQKKLKDYHPSTGILQFENKAILLPRDEEFYPSLLRLAEYRLRFGYE